MTTIIIDYDNDQIRIEGNGPDAMFKSKKSISSFFIEDAISELLNRIASHDVSLRMQSDGELHTIEEW